MPVHEWRKHDGEAELAVFIDRTGRSIDIEVSGDNSYARHAGKQVGYVKTSGIREGDTPYSDLPAVITGWEVDIEYRRVGIATALVTELVRELGVLAPAAKNRGIAGQNSLTSDGEKITSHCQKLGLIHPHPVEQPDGSDWFG